MTHLSLSAKVTLDTLRRATGTGPERGVASASAYGRKLDYRGGIAGRNVPLDRSLVEDTGKTHCRVRLAPCKAGPTRPKTHRPLSAMGSLVLINRN